MEEVKELEKEFIGRGEVKGFIFKQIAMSDRGYLYKVDNCGAIYYEVFKRRLNFGCISYPTAKAFGIYAWTFDTLDKAKQRFNEL